MEGAGAVEELEVEGRRGLAVDFSAGTGLHGHVFVVAVRGVEGRAWYVLSQLSPHFNSFGAVAGVGFDL